MNNGDEVYTVEECEPGIFQSVFPTKEAEYSAMHSSVEEAWEYIEEIVRKLLSA